MKLSSRELILLWCTLAAVLGGLTWWMGDARWEAWQEVSKRMKENRERIQLAERLLERRGDLDQRLADLRARLPQYPAGRDVTPELLKNLERVATDHGLTLGKRVPQRERSVSDLFEVSIECTWDGSLDNITHFLHAMQSQGPVVDIQQLTATPAAGVPGRLKGTFTVDYAYTRAGTGGTPSP